MQLLAVSKDTIRAHVIRYFHRAFGTPLSAFKPDTNVRKAYHYSDPAWRALANALNQQPWMIQLGVVLGGDEMMSRKTIDDLTSLIWDKINKVVAVHGLPTSLKASGVKTLVAPQRRSSARKKTPTARKRASKPKAKHG